MISETDQKPEAEVVTDVKPQSFLDKLVWKEGPKSKWYLDKRQCNSVEPSTVPDPDILTFDIGSFDIQNSDGRKIECGDTVISELGKTKVSKIESNQVYVSLDPSGEPIPVQLDTVKKFISVNFLIIGKTKVHQMENFEININNNVSTLKTILSDYLTIPSDMIEIYSNDSKLDSNSYVYSLNINDKDNLYIAFVPGKEIQYKRSTSRDYSWYDQKNMIPFVIDRDVIIHAVGFWKHTDTTQAIYDFFVYEMKDNGEKSLVTSMTNVKVLPSEVDSSTYIKKVPCSPFLVKADVTYRAYVNYKIPDMRTYYSYSGSEDQTVDGVRVRILNLSEENHRSSTGSGHMPHLYFKICNPYDE